MRQRYRFTDAPTRCGFRMVKLRYPEDAEREEKNTSATSQQLRDAYHLVAELTSREGPNGRSTALKEAREKLEHLRFVFEDHAPTHAERLAAYAKRLREFWARQS